MTAEDEAFRKAIEKKKRERQKPFLDALMFARSVVATDSGRDFIASCQSQLAQKGFLTEKQVTALYQIDEKIKREYGWADSDKYDYERDDFAYPYDEYDWDPFD